MPAYNAASFLDDAIESVIRQTYTNWELIIINDGSTDNSEEVIKGNFDSRIRYIYQENGGVSKARNTGLRFMQGAYFCFLDADDVMPPKSIASRIGAFLKNDKLVFVDGVVLRKDKNLDKIVSVYKPSFEGNPRPELLRLSSNCFLGNTWMVKRNFENRYAFNEQINHLEDYLFFLEISQHGIYGYVAEEILWYRQGHVTAMSDLLSLEKGYYYIYNFIKKNGMVDRCGRLYLKYRICRILVLSNLFIGRNPVGALRNLFYFLR
jgi:glycosyltransferase involved in cell wall biosynthesis